MSRDYVGCARRMTSAHQARCYTALEVVLGSQLQLLLLAKGNRTSVYRQLVWLITSTTHTADAQGPRATQPTQAPLQSANNSTTGSSFAAQWAGGCGLQWLVPSRVLQPTRTSPRVQVRGRPTFDQSQRKVNHFGWRLASPCQVRAQTHAGPCLGVRCRSNPPSTTGRWGHRACCTFDRGVGRRLGHCCRSWPP
jgi:hypothetical protein